VKNRQELKNKVGNFILESTLEAVGDATSPIQGEKWKSGLSSAYAKKKKGKGSLKANMELSGDMLDALNFKKTDEGIIIGVFGSKQADKADGHNKLTGRANPFLKEKRRFIPETNQKYKSTITDGIKSLVAEHVVEKQQLSKTKLQNVASQTAFNDLLRTEFPDISLLEAKSALKNTPSMFDLLDELDLLRFLNG